MNPVTPLEATTDEMIREATQLFSAAVHLFGEVLEGGAVISNGEQFVLRTFLEGTAEVSTNVLRYMDENDLSRPITLSQTS